MTEAESTILTHLEGMRRELVAVLETQVLFAKRQERFLAALQTIEAALQELRGDVVLLENHNLTRHLEILKALERIEALERGGAS